MIRSVLTLRTAAGKGSALEDLYAEHGVLARAKAFPGCRDALLLRSADGEPCVHLVVADWDCAADYQNWLDDPWRAAVSQQLASLLETGPGEPVVGRLYEFV